MRRKCKGKENPMTSNNSRLIDGRIRKLFEFREMVGEKEEKKNLKNGIRSNGEIGLVKIGQRRGKDRGNGAMARTYLEGNFPTTHLRQF